MKYVNDTRPEVSKDDVSASVINKIAKAFDFLFHNPIASALAKYNPLTMLINAAEEGIAETFADLGIKLPEISPKAISDAVEAFFEKEGEKLVGLLVGMAETLSQVVQDPSKLPSVLSEIFSAALWIIVDAIKGLIIAIYDVITDIFDVAFKAVDYELSLGIISDLWKDFADQPLSILNVVTYLAAHVLNLITLVVHGKLP